MSQRDILPSFEPAASQCVVCALRARCRDIVAVDAVMVVVDAERRIRSVVGGGCSSMAFASWTTSAELVSLSGGFALVGAASLIGWWSMVAKAVQ